MLNSNPPQILEVRRFLHGVNTVTKNVKKASIQLQTAHFSRLYKNNMFNTPLLQTDSSTTVEVCVCHQTELLEHELIHPETIKEINVDESPLRLH